ncbi:MULTISPECIES: siderophore ABC transporter substrate-binding protein [unclassified Mesorhizobium]|uniref:siderophore ABC transporter substrate-binding protein n=2 Tax=Mesorhizobium TaxID=68287 RepID=UPI000FD576CC|nr:MULTISPECIES: siderophore ABC transporter substrate-binding protein [unclassified Mesorhizobium]RUV77757.1 siderophore ABC transporter substrate-binding protein [Mesorhizobium sp. M5C.F.Ca.IN.020.14.1.1]RUV30675.1 siderophore ABC transporter substrate-binding protein [Mesorhizobium sp. M5C.F.Ca.IN.020.32.2.1]RWG51870.1 MAG: siderophore ABC transporter substrate-binding protein [Mesorhizobium sp.]RWH59050.1 MAG: siderophore ABC transporter substrate-binding protein [Mesorhizobium sp.]RWI7824
MKWLKSVLALPALALFLVQAFATEIETAKGPVTVDKTPQTLAVFDIAAVDTLNSLGVKIAGLPDKLYVPELAGLKDGAEIVGTLFEPDLEALSALAPDLIIVGGRSSPQLAATSRIAQSIDMTMEGDDLFAQAKQRLMAYGALVGKPAEAAALAAELDAALSSTRAAVKGKGTALILMTSGPKVTAYGKTSRFGWLHSALQLTPTVEDVEAATHGEAISFEFLRDANPDWLIVLDRGAAIGSGEQNARATLDNELAAETTAWKKGQVVYMPAADFYIAAGGVQSTMRVLEAIRDAFSQTK